MTMTDRRRTMVLGCLGLLLAACGGGSGSTGLITSEGVLIDDVRRTGTCGEFDGAPYCATDSPAATAPGGQSASVVSAGGPTPVRTPTPAVGPTSVATATAGGATATASRGASATPGSAPSPTPVGTPGSSSSTPGGFPTPTRTRGPATATPIATPTPAAGESSTPVTGPTATPTSAERSVTVAVEGFASGAACATATRAAGSEDAWRTARLVAVDDSGAAVSFPLPAGVADPFDLTLLCFDDPPAVLPFVLATLADANPTVVFVLPSS
jgi:hypothetical protein